MAQAELIETRNGDASAHLPVGFVSEWPSNERKSRYEDSFAVASQSHTVHLSSFKEDEKAGEHEGYGHFTTSTSSNYTASSLVESGVEHNARGEHRKALKAFHAALKAQRASLGDDDICIAHTLGNIGAVYLRQGRLMLASEALEEALLMKMRLRAKEKVEETESNILLADVLNNLGNVAYLQGDHVTALKYYRRNLRDLRSRTGPQKELANTLHNIGRLNAHQKEWDAALSVLNECHKMEIELYGSNNIQLVDTLNLIGSVHLSSLNFDAAMHSFNKALSMVQDAYGPLHPSVATSLLHIGAVREANGNLKDAWEAYDKARSIFLRSGVDHSHRDLKIARRSIANVENLISFRKSSGVEKQSSRSMSLRERYSDKKRFCA